MISKKAQAEEVLHLAHVSDGVDHVQLGPSADRPTPVWIRREDVIDANDLLSKLEAHGRILDNDNSKVARTGIIMAVGTLPAHFDGMNSG
jgi:hypothetical protein